MASEQKPRSRKAVSAGKKPTARASGNGKKTASQPRHTFVPRFDLYRLAGAIALLFFGVIGVVSWFNRDAALMNAYYSFVSAQFGWGYYFMPLCMLWSAWLMGTKKDRPCSARVACVMAADLLLGAFVQLGACNVELLYSLKNIMSGGLGEALHLLAVNGQDMTICCGGIFSGMLAAVLYTFLRRVFGCILLALAEIPLCVYGFGGSVKLLWSMLKAEVFKVRDLVRLRGTGLVDSYEEDAGEAPVFFRNEPQDEPVQQPAAAAAEPLPLSRADFADFDVLLDDEPAPKPSVVSKPVSVEVDIDPITPITPLQGAARVQTDIPPISPKEKEQALARVISRRTKGYSDTPRLYDWADEDSFDRVLSLLDADDADIRPAVRPAPEPPEPEPVPPRPEPLIYDWQDEDDDFLSDSDHGESEEPEIIPAFRPAARPEPRPEPAAERKTAPAPKPEPKQEPVPVPAPQKSAGSAPAAKPAVPAKPAPEPVRSEPAKPAPEESAEGEYVFPPLNLLRRGDNNTVSDGDEESVEEELAEVIQSYGVSAQVIGSVRGPSITRYELKLAQGVKLQKITNLSNDIALSLGVSSVRIAPIPDMASVVGVEVPNRRIQTVWLGDTIDSDAFRKSKSKVSVALGKDISGNVIVGNIAKMPHVLIAGTTGSGKSVCINSLILSLLYKSTPDEVKLIMVDPKMVELGIYNSIPHMLVPVVTDSKKAAGALQWAVVEMMKRYRLFSERGVRDLATYNEDLLKEGEQTIPQIVIIIDELADLMMVAAKEVEESICRVAQMGRAAGMHLVVATQRPSANVITGLMKANIPSRIAFAVSSGMDSRIILDQQGAEKLIGMGDMLYSPIGVGKPVRVQGAFVTDEEREEVINFIKEHCEAEYSDDVLSQVEKNAAFIGEKPGKGKKGGDDGFGGSDSSGGSDGDPAEYTDELLPQAVEVIFEAKQASTSMLQRRLKLGYSRAGRLIDQMEQLGVVGPYQGSKPREILMTKQQWQEMQYVHGTAPTDSISQEYSAAADMSSAADSETDFLGDD